MVSLLTPQFAMSPGPMLDYELLEHAHGSLVDSAFMYNWEDLTTLSADWGLPDAWNVN
jgi:hypothetical protein